ncbi:MAG: YceI family protein [Leptospiraceae bacterium]|nr:YceI family protein [Leptospiraceae bacterium]
MNKIFMIVLLTFGFSIQSLLADSQNCKFEYDPSQTKLEWTAYKFTEKTGVKGTFDKVAVSGTIKSDSIQKSMASAKFTISPSDINSSVPDRDSKIKEFFFDLPKNQKPIVGTLSDIKGNSEGTAFLILNLNGISKKIPLAYKIDANTIIATGEMDLVDFGLSKGLAKLNEVCLELHKGADGKSKLWPNVSLKIESKFKSSCK